MVDHNRRTPNGDSYVAKKQKVNKSQAVRDYLKANGTATNTEVADALTKKGIKVTANYVATLKSQAKRRKARKAVAAKPVAEKQAAVTVTAVAAPEPSARPANTVTIDQIRAVAQMVKTSGGFARLHEMLGLIKEVGGLKKFKDLLEAMAVS
jgi:hypothetical protein